MTAIVIIATVLLSRRKKKRTEGKESQDIEFNENQNVYALLPGPTASTTSYESLASPDVQKDGEKWIIKYEELSQSTIVGQGSFGVVYKGEWRNAPVASSLDVVIVMIFQLNN